LTIVPLPRPCENSNQSETARQCQCLHRPFTGHIHFYEKLSRNMNNVPLTECSTGKCSTDYSFRACMFCGLNDSGIKCSTNETLSRGLNVPRVNVPHRKCSVV
jgi:hypothetical protein